MSFSFIPKALYPSLTAISPEELCQRGIRLLMLDFDNTIVPYTTDTPTPEMIRWLKSAQSSELQLCVVSNSRKTRVTKFCDQYNLPCITRAKKPFGKGISICMERYGLTPNACALVGDQIYTDILGANCSGVYSILIPAIHNHNIWLKLRHFFEKPWISIAKKRRMQNEKS